LTARFCDYCGTPATSEASADTTAARSQARKTVTVVFADLAGSTSLGEQIDPESVRTVMDRYYSAIRGVVEEHNGRVVKFIGDGVMAVFGVPETSEDDVRRALDAALAMHAAFSDLAIDIARDRGVTIALRVGVNTGEVIVSAGDDDVVGDAVNLAARLERAAESGTVLAGEATWRIARGYAVFDAGTLLAVAGKAEPVRAYRLLSLDDADESRMNFVGRSAELGALVAAFNDAVERGTARLATVLGSPGVGKTRLAAELERVLAERATVLVTRCTPGGAASLAPVTELLRSAAAIDETTDTESITRAISALIPTDETDHARVATSATAVLSSQGGSTPEETLWAVRRLVEVAAHGRPVVVVIDDLQWGEPMLLDLVDHLAEWTRAPVLLVALARPELREVRASMVDSTRHTVVALEGLDREATTQLAYELLATDALPAGLLERLPESTAGNPLFLRELLRMLVDDQTLRAEDDVWTLTVAWDAVDVPPSIQALLAARIDRLPADEQLLLERASIAGKEFPLGGLSELLPPTSSTAVSALLESLRRKELVEPDGTYWIDEPVYRFHHVLIRDAAYRRVLRQTRAELHERLARWLESKVSARVSEYEELIGFHLEQAYEQRRELGLDTRGRELGREAGARLGAAAERALEREDLPSAGALAGRALACVPADEPRRADLLLVRCEAVLGMGEAAAAGDAIEELQALSTTSRRLAAWHACFAGQLAALTDASQLRDTEIRLATIADELLAIHDPRGAAKAHTVHAATLARLGRYAEVELALDRALTNAREAGDRRLATAALAAAPVAAVWGPSPVPRAGGRCLDVVRLLRITAGSPAVEATSQRCQGLLEAFRGRADAARGLVGAARVTLEELGLEHALLETELFAGLVELVVGDAEAARTKLRAAYDGLRSLGVDADAARAAALLARAHAEHGDRDQADVLAADAEQLAGDDLQSGIAWRAARAGILALDGKVGEAVALAEAAVRIAADTDALVHHAEACLALASARRAAGDAVGAAEAARTAADLYARKGATHLAELARALADREPERREVPTARGDPRQALSNRCLEVLNQWNQLFARRDWNAMRELVAAEMDSDDRRAVIGVVMPSIGWQVRTLAEQDVERLVITPVATRGERAVLVRMVAPVGDFENPSLAVVALDEHDRLASLAIFEDQALDEAFEALDARYLAGEGAPYADAIRVVVASVHAYNTHDWDAFHTMYTADCVTLDHRPAGWGTLHGPAAQVDMLQPMIAMVPDVHMTMDAVPVVTTDAVLYSATVRGHDAAGGGVELAFHLLNRIDAGDRITALEIFPGNALDEALAALHRPPRRPRNDPTEVANQATDTAMRFARFVEARDWDALRPLQAPGYRNIDRRALINDGDVDAVDAHRIAVEELGVTNIEIRPIAVRGDRLALSRQVYSGPHSDSFEVEFIFVLEVDDAGRQLESATFELADLPAAVALLEQRYVEGQGAPFAEILRLAFALNAAFNARNEDAMRRFLADDLEIVDHRSASIGVVTNRAALMSATQAQFQVAADLSMIVSVIKHSPHGWVALLRDVANADGEGVEITYCEVVVVRDGRVARLEYFAADAFDAAIKRLGDLGPGPPSLENACTRHAAELRTRWMEADWDGVAELLADDAVWDDRRPLFAAVMRGRDAYVQHVRTIGGLGEFEVSDTTLAVRGERAAMIRRVTSRSDGDDPLLEVLAVLTIDEHGRSRGQVVFDAADFDAALAELERTYVADEAATDTADNLDAARARYAEVGASTVTIENAASRIASSIEVLRAEGQWGACARLLAADATIEDRRRGARTNISGRDACVASFEALNELGTVDVQDLWMAVRGDRLALGRRRFAAPDEDGAVVDVLMVNEIDADGLAKRQVVFDLGDDDAAYSELERLYLAGEAVAHGTAYRIALRYAELVNAHAWDDLLGLWAGDLAVIDHRPGGFGRVAGRDEYLDLVRYFVDLAPDARVHALKIHHLDEYGAIALVRNAGSSTAGVEAEILLLLVILVRADHVTRIEQFPPDALASAQARFAELTRPSVALENDCTRTMRRQRDFRLERDWVALADLTAEDIVSEDRRRGMGLRTVGRAEALEHAKIVTDVAPVPAVHSVVATRGERLALTHVRLASDDGTYESDSLWLAEINGDGQLARNLVFDADDLETAVAALDARYLDTLTAAEASSARLVFDALAAYNARDWGRYRSLYQADATAVDHRPTGWGEARDPTELTRNLAAMVELIPDLHATCAEVVCIAPHGAVSVSHLSGTSPEGTHVESIIYVVSVIRDGLGVHMEMFPEDARDAAQQRFAGVAPQPAMPRPNRAFEAISNASAAIVRHDQGAFAAQHAPGYRNDDRRTGVRHVSDGLAASTDGVIAEAVDANCTLLATRGEQLALVRDLVRGRTARGLDWEIDSVALSEVDDAGLILETVVFDANDVDSALAELDARFVAGEGAPYAENLRSEFAITSALNARDWAALRALHVPDYDFVDHRAVAIGTFQGRDEFFDAMETMVDATPDVSMFITMLIPAAHGSVAVLRERATNAADGEFDNVLITMKTFRDELVARSEIFNEDQLDEALARLAAFAAQRGVQENACVDVSTRLTEHVMHGELAAARGLITDDIVVADRRRGLETTVRGPDMLLGGMAEEVADLRVVSHTIATRGDRLALFHRVASGRFQQGGTSEVEALVLCELDASARCCANVRFDVDAHDAAIAELEERFLAGEAASHADVWRTISTWMAATREQRWSDAAALAPRIELFDHRPASFGMLRSQEVQRLAAAYAEITPGIGGVIANVSRVDGHGAVVMFWHESKQARATEGPIWATVLVANGGIARLELFAEDARDAALRRLDELRSFL
jgi:class 3 adenylate cyclase